MFQSLSPSTTYTVSIAMRNALGEGPQAVVNGTTSDSPTGFYQLSNKP